VEGATIPAAALQRGEQARQLERLRDSEIAAAVIRLRSADCGTLAVVEPLARQLTPESFVAVVEKLEARTRSGSVRNDAALLLHLLRVAVKEQMRLEVEAQAQLAASAPAPLGLVERVKREDPERYLRSMAGVPGFDVEQYLATYVDDQAERDRLRGVAA
jgi:hypothetical protein